MNHQRRRLRAAPLAAACASLLLLAGCAAGSTEEVSSTLPTPTSTPGPSRTATAAPSAMPTATAGEQVTGPPQGCLDYEPAPIVNAEGGDSIAAAAATAPLPATVVLNPGVQVIASVNEPGALEAVARLCSTPLARDALVEFATGIARAIYADPIRERVSVLVVSAWTPDDSTGYLKQVDSVTTDEYQLYLWDSPVAQNTAWE